jgi:hypothetical protein
VGARRREIYLFGAEVKHNWQAASYVLGIGSLRSLNEGEDRGAFLDAPETFLVSVRLMFPLYFLDIFLRNARTELG